jgi:hypothetical protein
LSNSAFIPLSCLLETLFSINVNLVSSNFIIFQFASQTREGNTKWMQCKMFKIINIYLDFIQLYEFLVGYKINFLTLKRASFSSCCFLFSGALLEARAWVVFCRASFNCNIIIYLIYTFIKINQQELTDDGFVESVTRYLHSLNHGLMSTNIQIQ